MSDSEPALPPPKRTHYLHYHTVDEQAIDGNGHVNNVEYVRWMQDAAVAHSGAVGCTAATDAAGATWVVRSHHIEYLRPAFLGDELIIRTWVENARRAFSLRKYEFSRTADKVLVARGQTDWVYVDAVNGRPRRIPAEIYRMFGLAAEEIAAP